MTEREEKLSKIVYKLAKNLGRDVYVTINDGMIEFIVREELDDNKLEYMRRVIEENGYRIKSMGLGPGLMLLSIWIEIEEAREGRLRARRRRLGRW